MAVASKRVAVDTNATLIVEPASITGTGSTWSEPRIVIVRNAGAADVALGPSGLVYASSFVLPAGEKIPWYVSGTDKLYARTGAGSTEVHVLETDE